MLKPLYAQEKIVLTTRHQKEKIIAPIFQNSHDAHIVLCDANTDLLGTFSGEIERVGSAIDCVKKKCLWGMELTDLPYGLASEGSFGPHPTIPFVAGNQEIICFHDKKRDFFLIETYCTTETNYQTISTNNWDSACKFLDDILFPEHGVIVKPNMLKDKSMIFKGIKNMNDLKKYFDLCQSSSSDNQVRIDTDMRAHMNPLRQKAIQAVTKKIAERLHQYCPQCLTPGWGKTDIEKGLPCIYCYFETELAKKEIWSCAKCDYKEYLPRVDGIQFATQAQCSFCNP